MKKCDVSRRKKCDVSRRKKCDVVRKKKCRLYKMLTVGAGVTMGVTLTFFVVMIRGVKSCIETLDMLRDNSKE